MDSDLLLLDRDALAAEVMRLRAGIRRHRDSTGHDLCWWHPELWSLLPEATLLRPEVPPREEFLRCCEQYRRSLDATQEDQPCSST